MLNDDFNRSLKNNDSVTDEKINPVTGETWFHFSLELQKLIDDLYEREPVKKAEFEDFLNVKACGYRSTWLEFCWNNGWPAKDIIKCRSHYIAIPKDESCCYLLKGQRPRKIEGCEKVE